MYSIFLLSLILRGQLLVACRQAAKDKLRDQPIRHPQRTHGVTVTISVHVPLNSCARLQHNYFKGDAMSAINTAKREAVATHAGYQYEKKIWDSKTQSEVPNPHYMYS